MKIIVVCISLGLVACTRSQIKSYFRICDVESGGRWLRSTARDASKEITGAFYIPACSGGNQGGRGGGSGGSNFQDLNFQALGTGGGLSNQVGNGVADSNYFQGWGTRAGGVSNQGGSTGGSISYIQGWGAGAGGFSNRGSSGATDGSNFQGWTHTHNGNQGGSARVGDSSFTGPIGSAGGFSLPNGSPSEGSYGWPPSISRGASGGSFQGYSANAVSVSNQGGNEGTGDRNFQGWGAGAGGISNQGKSRRGGRGLPGPIRNAAGFQGYSRGPVSSNNRGGSADSETSEGRNIDPQLLEQVRFILLQEEASSELGGGVSRSSSSFSAPSFSYGAPSTSFDTPSSGYGVPSAESSGGSYGRGKSGRVVGIVFEEIYQSIQIAEKHQTISNLGPSRPISPLMTSPIPSRSFSSRR